MRSQIKFNLTQKKVPKQKIIFTVWAWWIINKARDLYGSLPEASFCHSGLKENLALPLQDSNGGIGKIHEWQAKTFSFIHIDQLVRTWQEENSLANQRSQLINENALKEEIDKEMPALTWKNPHNHRHLMIGGVQSDLSYGKIWFFI